MFSDGKKDWLNNKKMTMMGRGFTQRMLAKMVKNNCQYAIIETTSEGIRQFRHKAINYDILIFTGLYPEHIESHGSFNKFEEDGTTPTAPVIVQGISYAGALTRLGVPV
jgi:UDP-N-acetylmuramoyl-L-alanyl-D-glutamate--2,6-diaminopimelate ligase